MKLTFALQTNLAIALQALKVNKLRSALTMLGIIIGVGAVIAMVAIGQGAQASVDAQISTLGTNVLMIYPGSMSRGGVMGCFSSSCLRNTISGVSPMNGLRKVRTS